MAKSAHTGTQADGGAKSGGHFPPFQSETFASQLLWLVLAFGVLYLLMSRIALPRVGQILEERRDRIASDLSEAEALREKSQTAISDYEKALADARARAQAIASDTRDALVREADSSRKSLEEELTVTIAKAEARIVKTKTEAMRNVRVIAVEATADIVAKLAGTVPQNEVVAQAVDTALKPEG